MPLPTSFTTHASTHLARVVCGASNIELVHVPHDQWPLPRAPALMKDKLRISVLDSSFNPPTLAHLALARAPAPPLCPGGATEEIRDEGSSYDAHLLLLSIRNADKPLEPGDATHLQRLEMMFFFAQDIAQPPSHLSTSACSVGEAESNVAIAIINAPLFIDKSTVLLHFFRRRLSAFVSPSPFHNANIKDNHLKIPQTIPEPRLTFLLGFDTLERLFSPRCYLGAIEEPMLDALRRFFSEGSTFVCAKRDPSSYPSFDTPPLTQSPAALSKDARKAIVIVGDQEWSVPIPSAAQEFMSTKQITLIDIGSEKQSISSSNVRLLRLGSGDSSWKNLVGSGVGEYIQEKGLYTISTSDSVGAEMN